MKRILKIALALALAINTFILPTFAADTTASSMTLEKTEGSVTIKNAAGIVRTVRDGGRLYSGYQIQTGDGYAWISLDDSKVIKLDRYTTISIRRDGSKLEVIVNNGEIFFDVSKALESDESLYIKTSTMYASVRGTIGIVTAGVEERYIEKEDVIVQEKVSSLILFEGQVSVTTKEEVQKSKIIESSQMAVVSLLDGQTDELEIEVVNLDTSKIIEENPFAAIEIANSDSLQERIEQATGSDLTDVLENSEQLLSDYEKNIDEQEKSISSEIDEEIKKLEDTSSNNTNNSGSSSSSKDDNDTLVPEITYYTIEYYYETTLLGTSLVEKGETAFIPTIKPSENGVWTTSDGTSYNFTSAVESDLKLIWSDID